MSSFSEFLQSAIDFGKQAGEVYQSFQGDNSQVDEESIYLKGQLAGLTQAKQEEKDKDTIKIGDAEISTSSILWIIGGTLGLLAIGLGIKKML